MQLYIYIHKYSFFRFDETVLSIRWMLKKYRRTGSLIIKEAIKVPERILYSIQEIREER